MKVFKEIGKCILFGGMVFTITLLLFNLYATRVGGPTIW